VLFQQNFNTDYSSADLAFDSFQAQQGSGVRYRVVSAGLRVMYIGSELNKQGIYQLIQNPDHASLTNTDVAYLSNLTAFFQRDVDKKWHTISYSPVTDYEVQYLMDGIVNRDSDAVDSGVFQPASILNHHMGVLVFGAAPSAPFRFEAIIQVEVIGAQVLGKSPSQADLLGLSVVSNIVSPITAPILDRNPGVLESIVSFIPQSVSDLSGMLLTAATPALREAGKSLGTRMLRSAAHQAANYI